ncbi:MAG: hypothetical protein K6G80_10065 [Treponema sp.]|nr:hypothetical protein [Treponema sp.]
MGFGQGYTPQESAPQLPEGEYKAQIRGAQFGQLTDGKSYFDVFLNIKDMNGNSYEGFKPDTKRYFDRPLYPQDVPASAQMAGKTLQDMQVSWDRQITSFFDAFGIQRGDWNTENWRGKVGCINVKKDKSNPSYMVILPDAQKRQQLQQAGAHQQAPGGQQLSTPGQQYQQQGYSEQYAPPANPGFDDTIPF